jgi:urease accessory protein UreH
MTLAFLPAARAPVARAPACRLVFTSAGPRGTALAESTAGAPWRVVRATTAHPCDATLVQTQGGLLDGDRWRVDVHAQQDTNVRLRAVGATIAHRGASATRTRLRVARGAALTWRSPGVIAMDGARLRIATIIDVDRGSRAAVSEILATAHAHEAVLRLVVTRDGAVLYEERTGFRDAQQPWRLGTATHLGTAVAVTPDATTRARRWNRALQSSGAATSPRPSLLVARALGSSLQEVDALLGPLVEELIH